MLLCGKVTREDSTASKKLLSFCNTLLASTPSLLLNSDL